MNCPAAPRDNIDLQPRRGGAPYAYRLAPAAAHRLGYRRTPWHGPGYLAHTLDAVEAVCAIVRSTDPETKPSVALRLPESIAGDLLPDGPLPDAVIVLESGSGSAVVCLEIDEHAQHRTPIRDKLAAYRRALDGRPGWHALFVVPTHGPGPRAAPGGARYVSWSDDGMGHDARRAPVHGCRSPPRRDRLPSGRGPRCSPICQPARPCHRGTGRHRPLARSPWLGRLGVDA